MNNRVFSVALILLACAGGAHAQQQARIQRLRDYSLYQNSRAIVTCVVYRVQPAEEGRHFSGVRVVFTIRHGSAIKRIPVELGESYFEELRTGVYNFTGVSRKQVFVSMCLGRRLTYVFDVVGDKVIPLYKRTDGRVLVRPVASDKGMAFLQEVWPKNQRINLDSGVQNKSYWTDEKDGTWSRRLKWNGGKFKIVRNE